MSQETKMYSNIIYNIKPPKPLNKIYDKIFQHVKRNLKDWKICRKLLNDHQHNEEIEKMNSKKTLKIWDQKYWRVGKQKGKKKKFEKNSWNLLDVIFMIKQPDSPAWYTKLDNF